MIAAVGVVVVRMPSARRKVIRPRILDPHVLTRANAALDRLADPLNVQTAASTAALGGDATEAEEVNGDCHFVTSRADHVTEYSPVTENRLSS